MLRVVLAALALMVVSPTAAAAKDVVVVKLRDDSAAKPGKPRASKRKVVKKRVPRARKHARAAQRTHAAAKPKRKRVELRPMP